MVHHSVILEFDVPSFRTDAAQQRDEDKEVDRQKWSSLPAGLIVVYQRGIQVSMDGKGRYLDNSFVARLWRSVKYKEVYLKAYQTVAQARTGINAYLEFYNRQRPHQALGYRTPAEVYQNGQEGKQVAAQEVGLPSDVVKPSVGVGDSLNLALGLS